MKVRFTAEIIDDNGNTLKTPVSVETKVPDWTDFNCPSKFLKLKLPTLQIGLTPDKH